MNKLTRQTEIIKTIAKEPWQQSKKSLAERFGISEATLLRDFEELAQKDYQFEENGEHQLYLRQAGWLGHTPLKEATLRQMEILELLKRVKKGLTVTEIARRLYTGEEDESGEKTIERMVKDLHRKGLVLREGYTYRLNLSWVLPPLQLTEREKRVFYEALKVSKALNPLPELMIALEAKLKLSIQFPEEVETVYVQGRTPNPNLRRIHLCNELEQASRDHQVINFLYRKGEESAFEVKVQPLGIVYYWVLDKWYLIAQAPKGERTYALDQILQLELLEEHFEYPQEFKLKEAFLYPWGIYRNSERIQIKIRFYDQFSTVQRVREELRGRETCEIEEDEAGLLLTDTVEGLDEIAVWLRGFGASVEVLEPVELWEKMRLEWSRMLETYAEGDKDDRS